MTHEQIEAIAQKHVNEVLAEINEKVEREKERIETERIEKETRLREKQHEKDLARERAAEEKAEKDRIRSEQREQKAEEKRHKTESKLAEKKKREDEKIAEKESKALHNEQLAVGEGLGQLDVQNDNETELAHRREEAGKDRAADKTQGDQGAGVDRVSEFDAQKDPETYRKRVEKQLQAGHEWADVREDQAAAVGRVSEHDTPKDQKAYRKRVEEKPGPELVNAQNERGRDAEAVLHPNTALDDAKGKGIKSWLKEKKNKIGKRLSRHALPESPTKAESNELEEEEDEDEEEEEEEDLYGEQLPMASNWRETPNAREDSLRNVALAKHEDSNVKGKEREPVEQASAEREVERTEESGDEEFKDAKENFEPEELAGSFLAVKEEPMKSSSERGSRFKEEF